MDTLERIFELADKIFPEQQEFASALGVKPSIVSQWRNKITKSYERRLPKIAEVLGTSVEYLTTGVEKTPTSPEASEREKKFMQLFDQLTPEQQELVLAQLQGVLDAQEKQSDSSR